MSGGWWSFFKVSSLKERGLLKVGFAELHTPDVLMHHRGLEDEIARVGDVVVVDLALVTAEPADLDGVAGVLGVLDEVLDGGRLGESDEV